MRTILQIYLFAVASLLAAALLAGIFRFILNPQPAVIAAGIIVLTGTFWLIKYWRIKIKFRFEVYDALTIVLILILLSSLHYHLSSRLNEYFNPASDQYYWLALAESYLNKPTDFIKFISPFFIYKPAFFLVLVPFVAFLKKTLTNYQHFMLAWSLFHYAILVIALAELGKKVAPSSFIGLLAPLITLSLYWNNYYLISTNVVPQNIGLPLFFLGLLFLIENQKDNRLWIIYFIISYLVHLASMAMFFLVMGTTELIKMIKYKKITADYLRISIAAVTAVVLSLFLLYAFNILPQNNPSPSRYYHKYQSLFFNSQPYLNTVYANIILGLGILGIILIFAKMPKLWSLAVSGILMLAFTRTPSAAYYAFFASWQPFRYFLFLNPSLALLSLHPFSFFSKKIFRFLIIIAIITAGFYLLPIVSNQQRLVILDMFEGRSEQPKNYYSAQKNLTQKLLADNKLVNEQNVVLTAKNQHSLPITAIQWAVAPKYLWVFHSPPCQKPSYQNCVFRNFITNELMLGNAIKNSFIIDNNYVEE